MSAPAQTEAIAAAIDESQIPPVERRPAYARRHDFRSMAAEFVSTAADRGLRPGDRVLDVGCGVGRFAVGFAAYADEGASYEGIDTARPSIQICREHIGKRLPKFRFRVADVFNSFYRRDAEDSAASYRFPFEDASFDFAFSNSLYTHLIRADVENYLAELGRLLKPGGRTLNTFFLLNPESEAALERPRQRAKFPHEFDDGVARVRSLEDPAAAIAFREDFVRDAHAAAGLRIEDPIRYGQWAGRQSTGPGFGNKDIVVAVRE